MKNLKSILSLLVLLLTIACRSTDSAMEGDGTESGGTSGSAIMKVSLLGATFNEDPDVNPMASSKKGASNNAVREQSQTILMDDNKAVIATLTPKKFLSNTAQAGINPMAATYEHPLFPGQVFRLAVYNANGTYKAQRLFTINSAGAPAVATGGDLMLDGGQTYTFVAYSYNNSTDPGAVSTTANLNSATLSAISSNSDLMYQRIDNVTVVGGDNELRLILKHLFSEVSVILHDKVNGYRDGFRSVGNGITMDRHVTSNNSLKLSNGVITYGSTRGTKPVNFIFGSGPNCGNCTGDSSWASDPVLLVNPGAVASDMSTLNFPNDASGRIDIGYGPTAKSKQGFTVPNIVVKPGVSYYLNLRFRCTADATPTWPFSMSGGTEGGQLTQTFNAPVSDAGFVFDIYQLDNSFNMKINGVDLSNQEIQFQGAVTGLPRNIRFKSDGAYWGDGNVAEIYALGNASNSIPIIRIIIGENGSVSMMGRRTLASALEPLELYNGAQFSSISWNQTASNTVIATMKVTGVTVMRGLGTGKVIVNCP
ncbi:hypothetical protein CMU02_14850 [Elizabethkingia anophelis]|uniref:fimbrillin family protein n=1 Tax=Elizabethkingia anophelis TaxID=1117645 RepID=UPI002935A069|nr:hypothetical protein [Elizabethkingia anophelis]MDV3472656.1 hypothetical protein [Elizabethkingia anophelis]MDV3906072.1 hypothetical protein [Elizabethkingia anophelis]